ncbi:MAG: type II secretion system protein GspG [Myxococcales bacterium]|nr:type II secretion system protein GspG [Myxococcales bacterium]
MLRTVVVPVLVLLATSSCGNGGAPSPASSAKRAIALTQAQTLAREAYPQWAVRNVSADCPDLAELAEYVNRGTVDPWGRPYVIRCGAARPAGVEGIGVSSAGPDGKDDTDDDVRSW